MLKNNHSTFILSLKSRKGQVALFVALIFQILFLFFAMVINVGLLVHHKINLQNSVDLAAYYGAAKQAENLNALGHMNYQIRQSWKLLAWRYRMLGSAGEFSYNPYKKDGSGLRTAEALDRVSDEPTMNAYQEVPPFCITYIPFDPMPKDENTCKDMARKSKINLFRTPRVFGFLQITKTMASVTEMLRNRALERCEQFGSFNYLMLGKFVVAFQVDQRDRMEVINELSDKMSESTEDFYDLDGDHVRMGMETTFKNNLTSPNRSAITSFNVYNSLGAAKCKSTKDASRPVKWLSPVKIYPGFTYIDTQCDAQGAGGIGPVAKELSGAAESLPTHMLTGGFADGITELARMIGYNSNLNDTFNFSMGVEKNPWCVAYVGASAETQPVIPFSPFGGVKLKARAFFKPFGGRIGPWYKNSWSYRDMDTQFSDGNTVVDPLLPPRPTDVGSITGSVMDPNLMKTRAANYSRYVGDPIGLKSAQAIGYYSKSIYELSPQWKAGGAQYQPGTAYTGMAPSFRNWDALPFGYTDTTGDILAWDAPSDAPTGMRQLELSAIVPNAFDIAYYSIEPDFYHNYYTRMRDGFIAKVGTRVIKQFRPDIGYHKGYTRGEYKLSEFSVKDQIAEVEKMRDEDLPVKSVFHYTVTDWKNLLTGWGNIGFKDYSLNAKTFGNCTTEPLAGVPNPGNCVVGGSTGYSVKMVSSDWLNSELQLGGENTGKNKILNPPPDDF